MARKVALIDETDTESSFADGELACGQKVPWLFSPWPRRRSREGSGRVELLNSLVKVIGTHANRLSNAGNS
jgi:hypothetical protein